MPIIVERQRRLIEVGIIRVGERKGERTPGRPRTTFRITSRHKDVLEVIAEVYGGKVVPWEKGLFEVCIESASIKALFSIRELPDGDLESLSRNFEEWKGNTCTKRCDGQTCTVWKEIGKGTDGKPKHERAAVPCECDPDARKCKLVSRVSVILPEIPALGLWRLNTGSTHFESEVVALVETIRQLGLPSPVPVTLTISTRESRTGPGDSTCKYPVVEIKLDPSPVSIAALVSGIREKAFALPQGLGDVPVAALPGQTSDESEAIEPEIVPEIVDEATDWEWTVALIGEQSARDWRSAFQGAGKDFDAAMKSARKNNVDAEKFHARAHTEVNGE